MTFRTALPLLFTTLLFACGSASEEGFTTEEGNDNGSWFGGEASSERREQYLQSSKYGMPMASMEMPGDWKLHQQGNGAWTMTGPGGVQVNNSGFTMFMIAADPGYNQMMQQNGQRVRNWIPVDQVLQQDIQPMMQQQGYTFVAQENAPTVAMASKRAIDPLYSVMPTQKDAQANVSEWNGPGNKKTLVITQQNTFSSQDMVNWGYFCTVLEADADRFATAKADLLHALTSVKYNPQYFAAYNAEEQQKSQQSWAQHNARMRSNQAAFDAQQAQFRANSNAVNDAIMGTWRSQNESSDRGQAAWVDAMREEQNAVDPYTGEQFKIESGSNQYWMNQYGDYYGTDDVLNDPNIGNTTNDVWRQVETE
ncbi:MAG: hypothetical protein KDB88_06580 [Flavobacteriales bacterium]|nr:hypothetical protein [Flavobacteriales bacterium]